MKKSTPPWRTLAIALLAAALAPATATACAPQVIVSADGTAEERGARLRTAIEASCATSQEIVLGNAVYAVSAAGAGHENRNDGIWISNRTNLTIRGSGHSSIIRFSRNTYIGLVVRSNVQNLTIRDLTIEGGLLPGEETKRRYESGSDTKPCSGAPVPMPGGCFTEGTGAYPNTHGIGSYTGATNVSNVFISNLQVRNLAVGISVGAETVGPQDTRFCAPNSYNNVTVVGNVVRNMYGRDSGSGYGIHGVCVENLLIVDNVIENTGRHAIYQGRTRTIGESPGNVLIVRNTVSNHGDVNGTFADHNRAAIAIARSVNTTAAGNVVIGSREAGISVESEGSFHAANNAVIGNHFVDATAAAANIWMNAPGQVATVWGNSFNGSPQCGRQQSDQPCVKIQQGSTQEPSYWSGTQWIELVAAARPETGQAGQLADARLFVMQNNRLHTVSPVWGTSPGTSSADSWPYAYSTTDWSSGIGFQGMAASDGAIYVLQNSVLHRVTPGPSGTQWPYSYSTTAWAPEFKSVSPGADGSLFIVQNGALHQVTGMSSTSAWPFFYSATPAAAAVRTAGGAIYVLYEATPTSPATIKRYR